MPECLKVVCIPCKALYKCSAFNCQLLVRGLHHMPVTVVCLTTLSMQSQCHTVILPLATWNIYLPAVIG